MGRVPVGDFLRLYDRADPPGKMTLERFLLKYGREFEAQALPKGYRYVGDIPPFARRQYRLAEKRGLVYVEGFAIQPSHPRCLERRPWCVDEGCRVIDVMWPKPKACSYFGIPFKREFVREMVEEKRRGSLLPAGYAFDPREFEGVDFLQELPPAGDEPP